MTRRTWHTCQPVDLHRLARRWFIGAKRIELQKLAVELGISRATAYRWAGSAEQLVGSVLAALVDDTFHQILKHTGQSRGNKRLLEVLARFMDNTLRFQPLRQFLKRDAQLGLKIVASNSSPVRRQTVDNLRKLLEEEIRSGHMALTEEPAVIACALTRIIESFLYMDLTTGDTPDLKNASVIQDLILRQG